MCEQVAQSYYMKVEQPQSNLRPLDRKSNTLTLHNHAINSMIKQPFYGPLIQDNPGEPVLPQRRDLLDKPLDFYELDVLPATQPIVSKHYRKTQWFGNLLFYRHGISTQCLTNSVKALKEIMIT